MVSELAQWPLVVQIHAGAAVLALLIGPMAIWRKRRDRLHRFVGATWLVLMLVVATSAWFITEIRLIGPFSPIHIFSLMTYWSIFQALRHVRAGRYLAHGAELRSLYLQALGIAGIFTLLPGRDLHALIFGEKIVLALGVMAVLATGLVVILRRKPRLQIIR